jgi:hypothetical protein
MSEYKMDGSAPSGGPASAPVTSSALLAAEFEFPRSNLPTRSHFSRKYYPGFSCLTQGSNTTSST